MAWTMNGSAISTTVDLTKVILTVPFLVKKAVVVSDSTTAVEFLHGEATSPDIVIITNRSSDPAATSACRQTPSLVTYLKIDAEAAATNDVIMIWFPQASGGIS